ncbi:MAG: OmpP1/FadL family transporter [Beijerinckiaceae bacterium]|uniref:OmpP1/FadL family transporter n=1 Tax=Tabrizicola sp. TaxID=2005166 RepID=UPI003F2A5F0E
MKIRIMFGATVAALLTTGHAQAANGTQFLGYGVANFGLGGTGIAYALDATAAANNPAGMGFIGSRHDFGMTTIFVDVQTDAFGRRIQDKGFAAAVPNGGINFDLRNGWTLGISSWGGGAGVNYGQKLIPSPFVPGSNFRSSLNQVFIAPTATYEVAPGHRVGFSVVGSIQRLSLGGLQFIGKDNPGSDWAFGAGIKVGYMGQIAQGVTLGLTYQSPIWATKMGKYDDVIADKARLTMPQEAGVGLAFNLSPSLVFAIDYKWINWSASKAVGNAFDSPGALGASNGPGFGWKDQHVIRAGLDYMVNEKLTVRLGGSIANNQSTSNSTFLSALAPLISGPGISSGFTYKLDQRTEISLAVAHEFQRNRKGTGASTGIDLSLSNTFVVFGFGQKF